MTFNVVYKDIIYLSKCRVNKEIHMEIIMPIFSERIKELRRGKNLKQKDMAELLHCTDRHYQRIEYGEVNLPSLDLLFLADYFGVSADYLLGRTERREVNR